MSHAFKYLETRAYEASTSYQIPNENVGLIRSLVAEAGTSFGKALAICSAGEIPLTCILPSVTESLIAVDHAKGSLMYAIAKALLLSRTSGAEIVSRAKYGTLTQGFNEHLKDAAAILKFTKSIQWYQMTTGSLNMLWSTFPERVLDEARERLELLTFVHGDMSDTISHGPFDLIYSSNAHDHSGVNGRLGFRFLDYTAAKNAHLIHVNYGSTTKDSFGWECRKLVNKSYGYDQTRKETPNENNWVYMLHRTRQSAELQA